MKEYKIGDVFEWEGVKLECVEDKVGCAACYIGRDSPFCSNLRCSRTSREDSRLVRFIKHEEPKMKKPLFESEEEIRQFLKDCFVYSTDNNIGASDNSIISENKTVEMAKACGYIKKSIVEEAEEMYKECDISQIHQWSNHTGRMIDTMYSAIQHLKKQLEGKK